MELIDILEVFRDHLVEFSILIFEFIGVGIIIVSGIHGFYLYLKKSPDTKPPALQVMPTTASFSSFLSLPSPLSSPCPSNHFLLYSYGTRRMGTHS